MKAIGKIKKRKVSIKPHKNNSKVTNGIIETGEIITGNYIPLVKFINDHKFYFWVPKKSYYKFEINLR